MKLKFKGKGKYAIEDVDMQDIIVIQQALLYSLDFKSKFSNIVDNKEEIEKLKKIYLQLKEIKRSP